MLMFLVFFRVLFVISILVLVTRLINCFQTTYILNKKIAGDRTEVYGDGLGTGTSVTETGWGWGENSLCGVGIGTMF